MRTFLLMLAVVVSGCASAAGPDGPSDAAIVVSPSVAAAPFVDVAVARWRAATGLEIVVGPGGTPIELADSVSALSGYAVCANTESSGSGPIGMTVDATPPSGKCREVADTIAHELGHVICRTYAPATTQGECHTEAGLMRSGAQSLPRDSVLDAAALEAVCAVAPCSSFQPE